MSVNRIQQCRPNQHSSENPRANCRLPIHNGGAQAFLSIVDSSSLDYGEFSLAFENYPELRDIPNTGQFVVKPRALKAVYCVKDVSKIYGSGSTKVDALMPVSLRIFQGSTTFVGPNGSGKSTLLNLMAGIDHPTTGAVWLHDQRIPYGRSRLAHFRRRIAYIRQDLNLFSDATSIDNVGFALTRVGFSCREARRLALDQLSQLGISEKHARKFPDELSGGQRQRIAIARALLAANRGGAEVILADEPTASVDSVDAIHVFAQLLEAGCRLDVPVIVVTHNPEFALLANRRLYFRDGAVSEGAH